MNPMAAKKSGRGVNRSRAQARARRAGARKKRARSVHGVRFPGETARYRGARDRLLAAERELRRHLEQVAALRRKLPLAAPVAEDYAFESEGPDGSPRTVRLSELFAPGKDSLIAYSFMYGPNMERPCPSCTSILDSLDGAARHVTQRANLVVIAKSPLVRIRAFARERGWRNLRLVSSAANNYNLDYRGEDANGAQWPALNVFVKRGGRVHHFYATELLFAPTERGQDPRHVDLIWPLWNLLDLTPEGRGTSWYPALDYAAP
jgi:predicted dithiol-disulfide oxidoreductase (DUF899 family)